MFIKYPTINIIHFATSRGQDNLKSRFEKYILILQSTFRAPGSFGKCAFSFPSDWDDILAEAHPYSGSNTRLWESNLRKHLRKQMQDIAFAEPSYFTKKGTVKVTCFFCRHMWQKLQKYGKNARKPRQQERRMEYREKKRNQWNNIKQHRWNLRNLRLKLGNCFSY